MTKQTKPIQIVKHGEDCYYVRVCGDTARFYGAKQRKRMPNGHVTRAASGKLDFSQTAPIETFTREAAVSVAHQIGRYLLGFGDLVFSYTEEC